MKKGDYSAKIRLLRGMVNMGQTEFARNLGIPRTSLINYEKGGAIPASFVEKLREKYSVNTTWFMYDEGEMFIVKTPEEVRNELLNEKTTELPNGVFIVPLLNQHLSAGNGSYLPDNDVSDILVRVPAYLSKFKDNLAALTVDGDSMYPTLSRGDMVVCDSCGWSGEGIYALQMSGDGYVKRLTKRPGKIVIISDNPKYPPQEEPEESQDIKIIGRVHCAIKQME